MDTRSRLARACAARNDGTADANLLSRPDFAGAPSVPPSRALSVGELNGSVRALLERGFPLVSVRGEVSNFTRAASGHLYFALKDAAAQVRCTMWKGRAAALAMRFGDGDAVEVRASVTLFEARGEYQLNVESVRMAGAGALFEAFVRLKEKLAREGLFDAARKRPLPGLPRTVAVVTSLGAAALRDVLATLKRRSPMVRIVVCPTPVQGVGAGERIARALVAAAKAADVVILCRGGGSIEDLWAFNEEIVARAIAKCAVPVISGVGHETDFTIADFVADLRAPTPTAAAEMVAPARADLTAHLARLARALADAFVAAQAVRIQRLDWAARSLVAPAQRLAERRRRLGDLARRITAGAQLTARASRARLALASARLRRPDLASAVSRTEALATRQVRAARVMLTSAARRLERAQVALTHLNPMRVLARGYAVVRDAKGRTLRDADTLATGDKLDVTLARGGALVQVEKPY